MDYLIYEFFKNGFYHIFRLAFKIISGLHLHRQVAHAFLQNHVFKTTVSLLKLHYKQTNLLLFYLKVSSRNQTQQCWSNLMSCSSSNFEYKLDGGEEVL